MIRFAFSTLKTDIERYQTKVADALREYSAKVEQDAKWYKEDVCAQRKQEHLTAVHKSVKDAEAGLALACRVAANKMRDCLKSMTTKPVDPGFLENMRTFREFGIKLNETELPTYINLAAGNLIALRILEDVAKASGFKLKYADLDTLNADIKRVERFGAKCQNYAPDNMWAIAREALPDVEYRRDDGSVAYSMGRPSFTNFMVENAAIKSMLRDCENEMFKRWTNTEVPSVEELVNHMKTENDEKSTGAHEAIAQADHEKAVKNAADSIDVEKDDMAAKAEAYTEMVRRDKENYDRVMKRYMR